MNVRQTIRERARARKWFASLSTSERNELGDRMVLGDIDWLDFGFERRPSAVFRDELDNARIHWETTGEG